MSVPQICPQPQHPITIIRAAILWCRAAGIPVRLGARNVECISQHALDRWERAATGRGVSPLGAAILHAQPEADEWYAAAAEAVSAPAAWVHGCEDGIDREEPSDDWKESLGRRLYVAGYEAGTMLREELIRVRPTVVGA